MDDEARKPRRDLRPELLPALLIALFLAFEAGLSAESGHGMRALLLMAVAVLATVGYVYNLTDPNWHNRRLWRRKKTLR